MARRRFVLKRRLHVEDTKSKVVTLPPGTEIERTLREKFISHSLRCRIIIARGVEYAAPDAAIDEAVDDRGGYEECV